MDIRCGSCSKLFRVADEKIAGNGIRFKCSRCGEVIIITKDDLEADLLARQGTETQAPRSVSQPAAKSAIPPSPKPAPAPSGPRPASAPQPEAREYQPQEYQPPQSQEQEIPPSALNEFDFSEPHAAAAASGPAEEAFGGKDFTFDASPEETAPVIGISPEAAADAEAALSTHSFSEEETHQQPEKKAQADHTQEHAPELTPEPTEEASPKLEPVISPKQRPKPEAQKESGGDANLGEAFTAPDGSEVGADTRDAGPPTSLESTTRRRTAPKQASRPRQEEIHPLASGNATGMVAGLGCAVPLVGLMTLGFGMMVKFIPFLGGMPLLHMIAIVGTGMISIGVVLGIIIALAQARAGKKLFFLVNVLIGTFFGTGLGIAESFVRSLMTGTGLNMPLIIANAVSTASVAFALSLLVVISRRIMVFSKDETFSQPLTGLQKTGLAVSLVIALSAVYEIGTFAGRMEQATGIAGRFGRETMTSAGLQVANANGYIDPGTGDLVITGSIRNMTDRPKAGWYLVTEVRDDKETVLTTVKMLSGIQFFTKEEYEILAKRGMYAEGLRNELSSAGKGPIPAKGSVDFELRVIGPPKSSARFLPTLQSFDPSSVSESFKTGTEH